MTDHMGYEEAAIEAIRERTAASRFPDPMADNILVLTGVIENVLKVHRAVSRCGGVTCDSCGGTFPCLTRQAIRDELHTLVPLRA